MCRRTIILSKLLCRILRRDKEKEEQNKLQARERERENNENNLEAKERKKTMRTCRGERE